MPDISRYTLATSLDWSYGGVNSSIPGNGGPLCASFSSIERRIFETTLASILSIFYTWWGLRCLSMPPTLHFVRKDRGGKRLLLVVVSMVFGMEIGFKFASKQLIYLLNPCHITTALQIYLLAAPPSRFVTIMFRIHLNYLNGAILAILFPVTNTRVLPFEEELYWLQHTLMLVTPYYLLRLGGVYTIEDLQDMSWTSLSTGIIFLYHFLPLQAIGLLSEVNLNNMLCPAISDPFYGPNYRLFALVHQSLCIPLVAKTFCAIATFFITTFPLTKVKDVLGSDVSFSAYDARSRNGLRHVRPRTIIGDPATGSRIHASVGSCIHATCPCIHSSTSTSSASTSASSCEKTGCSKNGARFRGNHNGNKNDEDSHKTCRNTNGASQTDGDDDKNCTDSNSDKTCSSGTNGTLNIRDPVIYDGQLECTEEFLVTEGYEFCCGGFGNAKEFLANHEHCN